MTYDTSTPRGTDTHVRLVSASLRLCVSASLRHPYSKLGGAARPTRDRALRPASAAARARLEAPFVFRGDVLWATTSACRTCTPLAPPARAAADGVGTYPFPRAPVRGELKMPKSSPSAASRLVSLFSFGARRGDRAAVTRATEPGPEKMDDSRMVARRRA